MENENDTQLNWWGRLIQNQGATIIAIIFMCGGLYAKIGVMEQNIQQVKDELKLVKDLDKSQEALKIRVDYIESDVRELKEWQRDQNKKDNK